MPIKADPFETVENLGKKAGQTVQQAVTVIGGDIAEQLGLKEIPKEEKQEIKKAEKKKVDYLTAEIHRLRQKDNQKLAEVKQIEKQEKQQKAFEVKKKKSLLQQVIDRSKGTKEIARTAGG